MEDVQCEQRADDEEIYWSTYVIKEWLRQWFEQNPLGTWTIDNYDGKDSYEELGMKTNRRHKEEPSLAPEKFHKMRATMVVIEAEMDEIVDPDNNMPMEEKEREWNQFREVALSVCDDYMHEQIRWDHPSMHEIADGRGETPMLESQSDSAEETNHEPQDQVDLVVRKGHVMVYPLEAKANQRKRRTRRRPRMAKPHLPRGERESDEENSHEPEDQEDPVDLKGRVMLEPRRIDTNQRVWKDQGQSYHVTGWSTRETQYKWQTTKQFDCVFKGLAKQRRKKIYQDEDEDTEEEQDQMVCNMNGQSWESLPFPIIIDSGACASVMPTSWCPHLPVQKTPGSEAGEFFRAANGLKIPNEGEKLMSMMTKEGRMRDMRFTVCPVTKALGSVSQMCRSGHRVVFNPPWEEEGSYIEHMEIGDRLWMEEQNGLYVLNTKVAPTSKQTTSYWNNNAQGFQRPASP